MTISIGAWDVDGGDIGAWQHEAAVANTLSGSIDLSIQQVGNLDIISDLSGAVNIDIETTGNLETIVDFSGSINISIQQTGDLEAASDLSGSINTGIELAGDISNNINSQLLSHKLHIIAALGFIYWRYSEENPQLLVW